LTGIAKHQVSLLKGILSELRPASGRNGAHFGHTTPYYTAARIWKDGW